MRENAHPRLLRPPPSLPVHANRCGRFEQPQTGRLSRARRNCQKRKAISSSRPTATRCGTAAAGVILGLLSACTRVVPTALAPTPGGVVIREAPAPSGHERYCAWYGDARAGVLYFGEAAFWSSLRAAGDPRGDLLEPGPQAVGRFDLVHERFLPALPTGARDTRSGTWDVLAHPNGRVYFTTFYESAGYVDPATGASRIFDAAGTGLNELGLGPDGSVLATRYAARGSVVVLDAEGALIAEHPLEPEAGMQVAPKSLAYDPVRRVVWVNTDLVPESMSGPALDGAGVRHDARVLELASGRELVRFEDPELQFMRFEPDGRGLFALLSGTRLALRITEPGAALGPASGREVVLDEEFPAGHDFVQDLSVAADGRVLATRWSGVVHVVSPAGVARRVELPRPSPGGLYYSAFASGDRVCASYCADVEVVCAPLP